jgi:hypothetical protein
MIVLLSRAGGGLAAKTKAQARSSHKFVNQQNEKQLKLWLIEKQHQTCKAFSSLDILRFSYSKESPTSYTKI